MAFNTSSRSVKEGVNKAKLKFEIPNFRDVVGKTRKGQAISSKQCDVGESKFALVIYPNGTQLAEKGMMSAYLRNESNHDVVVDFTISVEGGNTESWKNGNILKISGYNVYNGYNLKGRVNFMRSREVGTDLKITVEVKLKWEDISGGVVEQNQVKSKDLVQVDQAGLREKLKEARDEETRKESDEMKSRWGAREPIGPPPVPPPALNAGPPPGGLAENRSSVAMSWGSVQKTNRASSDRASAERGIKVAPIVGKMPWAKGTVGGRKSKFGPPVEGGVPPPSIVTSQPTLQAAPGQDPPHQDWGPPPGIRSDWGNINSYQVCTVGPSVLNIFI